MKVIKKIFKNSDNYEIIFGNEIFSAKYNKTYPKLGDWSLSRMNKELSNSLFRMFLPCYNKEKFKNLKDIKNYIKNKKYL